MAYNGPTREEMPHNPLKLKKFKMYGEKIEGSDRSPSLQPEYYNNNFRFLVWTGVADDKDKGRLLLKFAYQDFREFLYNLRDLAMNPDTTPFKSKVQNMRVDTRPGAERGARLPESDLFYGRDEQGLIYIVATAYKRPPCVFKFRLSEWHQYYESNGQPWTESKGSHRRAANWADMMISMIDMIMFRDCKEEEKRDNRQGGYGAGSGGGNSYGGGNRQGGGGYGGGQGSTLDDDDTPY